MSDTEIISYPINRGSGNIPTPSPAQKRIDTIRWIEKRQQYEKIIKKNIDYDIKQLDTKHSEQPPRAEVEATEQVENTYYSAVDTVYQKGKSLAENKLKQHRQQVKTKERVQASAPENTPKVQNKPTTQVKTKEAYIKSQKSQRVENTTDTVKTKQNYINAHKNAEIKQKPLSPHLPHSAAGRCFWQHS